MTQILKCSFRILFNPLWNVSVSTQHAGTKSNSLDVWPSLEWLWLRCFILLFEPEHFLKSILPSGKFFLAIQQSLYVLRRQHFGFDWLKCYLPTYLNFKLERESNPTMVILWNFCGFSEHMKWYEVYLYSKIVPKRYQMLNACNPTKHLLLS